MIVGDPSRFAIKSEITTAYDNAGLLALGYFVVHVNGLRYGVQDSDATMLACSFDEVDRRLKGRGSHLAGSAIGLPAGTIADAFRAAIYGVVDPAEDPNRGAIEAFGEDSTSHLEWTDGDEAFDDGSYLLQFDVGERVRLIAFRCLDDGLRDPTCTAEVWLAADCFYGVLREWHEKFHAEWLSLPKVRAMED